MSERLVYGRDGRVHVEYDTEGMFAPYRCTRCGNVHDAGKVTPSARYQDCTVWPCPGCGAQIDDRPIGWGGSAEKVERWRR